MFKLSDLFSPENYKAPDFSPNIKKDVFDVVNKKARINHWIKVFEKLFIPIWSFIIIWFLALSNLDYLNIWKPVEIYIQSTSTQGINWKKEIVISVIQTWSEIDSWQENSELIVFEKNPSTDDVKNDIKWSTIQKSNNENANNLTNLLWSEVDNTQKTPEESLNTIKQLMDDGIENSTIVLTETQENITENTQNNQLLEKNTDVSNNQTNEVFVWKVSTDSATEEATQTTYMTNPELSVQKSMSSAENMSDLTIQETSVINYFQSQIQNNIVVKNNWATIPAWSVIEIMCYNNNANIKMFFSNKVNSDIKNWFQYTIKEVFSDSYKLEKLSVYFSKYSNLYMTCLINENKTIPETNYENNQYQIKVSKTFYNQITE